MGGSSSSKQEQTQKTISEMVSSIVNNTSVDTNANTLLTSDVLQKLEVTQHPSSTMICLGGVSITNEIKTAMESNVTVFNQISSSIEQELTTRINSMMQQMLDSEVAQQSGGSGFSLSTPFGGVSVGGNTNNDQAMKTEVTNIVRSSVSNSVQSFIEMRTEMKAKAEQGANIQLKGLMISFGKCTFGNDFVGRLVANTVAKNIVASLTQNKITADIINSQASDDKVQQTLADNWQKILLYGGIALVVIVVLKLVMSGKKSDQQAQ